METFTELKSELQSRLMVADNSTLFSDTRLGQLINNAYLWAAGLFDWPELEMARTTDSEAGAFYYDYPDDYKTDSIYYMTVNGVEHDRKSFEDWLDFKRNNPDETSEKIFANHGRQYFIFPTPTASELPICIFGQIKPETMSEASDTTIFSKGDPQGNEAVIKKALSEGIRRADQKLAEAEEGGAVGILTLIHTRIASRNQRDQRLDHPKFDVPDFFATGKQPYRKGTFEPNN